MFKISFWLKKPNDSQASLEYLTIGSPKKVLEGQLAGQYSCEFYLSDKKLKTPLHSINPIDCVLLALEGAKTYLQCSVYKGYTISDIESKQEWKLEKKSPHSILKEKIDAIKNNKEISSEDKQKILKIWKGSFSKTILKV